MKILILNPPSVVSKNVVRDALWGCWCKGKRIAGTSVPPISQVLTATLLKKEAEEVEFLDALGLKMSLEELKKNILQFNLAVVQTSTMTFKEDALTLSFLKKVNPNLVTIIYGSHPTFMPNFSLLPEIDIIIRREHEYVLRDLVKALKKKDNSWKKVLGIGYKEGEKIILNDFYPFIKNLDELPFPDRALLSSKIEYFNPIVKRIPYTTAFTSRGCPAQCIFCTAPSFMGKEVRSRSAENVVEELEYIQYLGYREIFFRDETFTIFKERNIKICQEIIKRKINLTWICNARIGSVDQESLKLMKKAGCHMIRFGVESGVQEILNNIKKGISIDKTKETFKMAHNIGLSTHAHLMIGLPGDTKKTVEETIQFAKKISPTTATFGICTPYPGTELFKLIAEKFPEIKDGSDADLKKLHTSGFYNQAFTNIKSEELEKLVKKAYLKFYLRPAYFWKSLKRVNSLDELRRILIAGTSVLDFAFRGE